MIYCGVHPGSHHQTALCADVERIPASDRVLAWLERKLNPKQGDPSRPVCTCGNPVSGPRCIYCGARS